MKKKIYYNFVESPIGKIGVVFTNKEVLKIRLNVQKRKFLKAVKKEFGNKVTKRSNRFFKDFVKEIDEYFEKKRKKFNISFSIDCSEFQSEVLVATTKIRYGETITYGELARKIKRKGAARAVGGALKKNPIPLLIPCHRVLGVRGELVGFHPSIKIKRFLLTLEGSFPVTTNPKYRFPL